MHWRNAILVSSLFALSVLFGSVLSAAEPADLAPKVDALFADLAKPGSPGCALAVIRDGRIVYEKGYGLANVEDGVPIDPKVTVLDIGSTSKQFTAASALLLVQDGKLSLDDDIHKFLPELPDYGTPVTVRHLIHHTSGLSDYAILMTLAGINFADYATAGDGLAAIARRKTLDFPPGSEHSYSNSGYFLLSQIVDRVSGKSLRQFAQERIFGPLGMTGTRYFDDYAEVVPHRAKAYLPRAGGGFSVEMSDWEQTGDGGVQTTVEDLAKWDLNFYTPKVGGPWLIEQLQRTGRLNDGSAITYAGGLRVDGYRGLRRVSHGGGWAGYVAELMRFPEQRFSVTVLCNLGSLDPTGLALEVADLYLADALGPAPAEQYKASRIPAAAIPDPSRYAGLYWNPIGGVRRIQARDGKLVTSRVPGSESELAPIGDGRFELVGGAYTVELTFLPTAAGAPRRMQISVDGGKPRVYEEVQPAAPKPEDLDAYAGTYTNEELDTTWTLAVDGGRLTLHPKRGRAIPLQPAFTDAFSGLPRGLLRFQRNGEKKVTGFVYDGDRVRNLRFVRTGH